MILPATIVQGPSDVSYKAEIDGSSAGGSCLWEGDNSAEAICAFTNPVGEVTTLTTPLPTGTASLGTTVGAPAASSGASVTPGASLTAPGASSPSGSTKPATPSSSGGASESDDDGSASRATAPLAVFAATIASYWIL